MELPHHASNETDAETTPLMCDATIDNHGSHDTASVVSDSSDGSFVYVKELKLSERGYSTVDKGVQVEDVQGVQVEDGDETNNSILEYFLIGLFLLGIMMVVFSVIVGIVFLMFWAFVNFGLGMQFPPPLGEGEYAWEGGM
ncbi:Protein of unknown function [Pyronema omphalodes CBS 100304]|uniref:Transmembrane protein n=1 Tax=Pyronema omphalodes (strain CBS 100304) TaxID=1076935 RepID=U4LKF9_PYROM|nr:Protein of unknown function [Pyronema omphalodes CBS 100304]